MKPDMSAEGVTLRLLEVSRLRARLYYTPSAVTSRLRRVEQLRRLCLKLKQARPAGESRDLGQL